MRAVGNPIRGISSEPARGCAAGHLKHSGNFKGNAATASPLTSLRIRRTAAFAGSLVDYGQAASRAQMASADA